MSLGWGWGREGDVGVMPTRTEAGNAGCTSWLCCGASDKKQCLEKSGGLQPWLLSWVKHWIRLNVVVSP